MAQLQTSYIQYYDIKPDCIFILPTDFAIPEYRLCPWFFHYLPSLGRWQTAEVPGASRMGTEETSLP